MTKYIQIKFQDPDLNKQEILIAILLTEGYEGFEQEEHSLTAFIPQTAFNKENLDRISIEQQTSYSQSLIPATNWNQTWESSFDPVIIDDFAAIRAEFHEPIKNVQYEIIITPKMSFGTGHHATTYLMIKEMSGIDFKDQTVLDFGTGTGVLAILARKMGASKVVAIDYDDWSIENARENIASNECTGIDLIKQDHTDAPGLYGIILANINRNIILDNLPVFANKLVKKGHLLISGLLDGDKDAVIAKANDAGFELVSGEVRNKWNMLRFTH